jgi:NADH-ubiquinone oxidoreductase chain 6
VNTFKASEKKIDISLISKINILLIKLFSEIIQLTKVIILLISSIIFSWLKHPLTIGFLLLTQTLIICIFMGDSHQRFWFSYLLILVLFLYVITLASNELIQLSNKIIYFILFIILTLILIYFFIDSYNYIIWENINLIKNQYINIKELVEINTNIKLYNYPTNLVLLILTRYLFLTIVAVVKITKFNQGPLRIIN